MSTSTTICTCWGIQMCDGLEPHSRHSVFRKPCHVPFFFFTKFAASANLRCGAAFVLVMYSECAAHIHALSNFEEICSSPLRPHLQSNGLCTSMHDWYHWS